MRQPLRYYLPDYLFLLSISGAIVLFDQLTKLVVRSRLEIGEFWMPFAELGRFARIVHWKNTGAAFGMFQGGGLVFTILAIIVTIGILNFFPIIPRHDRFLRTAIALQLGGAVGNLIDRLTIGHVTDFVSVLNFPVFNVADASISTGVVLILIPILPHLGAEIAGNQLMKTAREANLARRHKPLAQETDDEPATLGLAEVLLAGMEWVRAFRLRQEIRRLRRLQARRSRGLSRV
ncbi:MAG TPA: signal peptidase II [Anaerolineales bacterium]|nr:signal peptidase II [Anaerolineales bacterium]